jgi:hypothetical protein
MGIGPITNLAPLPLTGSIASDLEPLPMARVENSARTGDETYSPSGGKSAGGSEDSGADEDFEELAGEHEKVAFAAENSLSRQVSFFA